MDYIIIEVYKSGMLKSLHHKEHCLQDQRIACQQDCEVARPFCGRSVGIQTDVRKSKKVYTRQAPLPVGSSPGLCALEVQVPSPGAVDTHTHLEQGERECKT